MTYEEFQSLFPDPDYSDVFEDMQVAELLETGSVQVQVGKRKFILAMTVEEVK